MRVRASEAARLLLRDEEACRKALDVLFREAAREGLVVHPNEYFVQLRLSKPLGEEVGDVEVERLGMRTGASRTCLYYLGPPCPSPTRSSSLQPLRWRRPTYRRVSRQALGGRPLALSRALRDEFYVPPQRLVSLQRFYYLFFPSEVGLCAHQSRQSYGVAVAQGYGESALAVGRQPVEVWGFH